MKGAKERGGYDGIHDRDTSSSGMGGMLAAQYATVLMVFCLAVFAARAVHPLVAILLGIPALLSLHRRPFVASLITLNSQSLDDMVSVLMIALAFIIAVVVFL